MRLTDLLDKEKSFKFLVGFVLALVFFVLVAFPSRTLSGFYTHMDGLSEAIYRGDYERADVELSEVNSFYADSRGVGMSWFADAYLFTDAFLQQASYNYLTGNFEEVVRNLADEIDDPRASHLLASAKFQLARQRYRAIPDDDENGEVQKLAIIQEVLDDVNADYERALRSDMLNRFDYKWNYDLTSDPEAVRRALEPLREAEPPQLEQMRGEGTPVRRRRG